jgi:hypothetical protein
MSISNPIYEFYTLKNCIVDNKNVRKYRCNIHGCTTSILWLGSPTNLVKHLKQHSQSFAAYESKVAGSNKRKAEEPKPAELSPSKRQLQAEQAKPSESIVTIFNRCKQTAIHDSMALAFMMNGWSLYATECKYLARFFQDLRQDKLSSLPTRYLLREAMLRQHAALKEQLIQRLKQNNVAVSLLLDGWTNVNKVKVTNLLLVSKGVAYYWSSISNRSSSNTADWLYNAIKPEMDKILDLGIPIVSYVADNEPVMDATHDRLVQDFPFLIRIPCAAHTIQLAVKKTLLDPVFRSVIQETLDLINLFISNKAQRLLLQNAQPPKTALKLIRPCDTRWSYTLYAVKRLLKLRNYIDQSLEEGKQEQKPISYWGKLTDLVVVLTPFSVATNIIQQDKATLFDVGMQFKMLQKHADSMESKQPAIALHITNCISNEWGRHINKSATIAAAILSAIPNISTLYTSPSIIDAQEFILNWGTEFLTYYQYSNAHNVRQELTNQFVEFAARSNRFEGFKRRVDSTETFIQKDGIETRLINPVTVWQSFRDGVLELASVAVAILSICASEAAVERSFSIQDRIHSKSRNRSKDDLVEAQVFVKFNTVALETAGESVIEGVIEISNDSEEPKPVELSYLLEEEEIDEPNPLNSANEINQDIDMEDEVEAEEQQEEELKLPPPVVSLIATPEHINAFLLQYIADNNLTKSSKLFGDKENALASAAANHIPRINTNIVDLKKLVKHLAPIPHV